MVKKRFYILIKFYQNFFIDICQLRLDFETFTLEGPSTTSEGPVGPAPATPSDCTTCTDSFTVTVSLKTY